MNGYILISGLSFLLIGCGQDALVFAGKPGHSAVFSQTLAGTDLCPNGGNVLNYGSDTNDNGVLDNSEINGVQITCNGTNDSDAVNYKCKADRN